MMTHDKVGGRRLQQAGDRYRVKLHALVVSLALLGTLASFLG